MIRRVLAYALALMLVAGWTRARAEGEANPSTALLHEAVKNFAKGKDELAFTQRGKTLHDDGSVKEERLERYDPSLPDAQRWHLIEVNGKPPTEEQRASIEQRRNRKPRKKANRPPEEMLDLSRAAVSRETPKDVTYEVPLRPEAARFFQTEKLLLLITVGRETRMIERVSAALRSPMKVALGLAKVTDVDFDLNLDGKEETAPVKAGKKNAPKSHAKEVAEKKASLADDDVNGTAKIAFTKLGERMEYEWSDFKRVDRYKGAAEAPATH